MAARSHQQLEMEEKQSSTATPLDKPSPRTPKRPKHLEIVNSNIVRAQACDEALVVEYLNESNISDNEHVLIDVDTTSNSKRPFLPSCSESEPCERCGGILLLQTKVERAKPRSWWSILSSCCRKDIKCCRCPECNACCGSCRRRSFRQGGAWFHFCPSCSRLKS